MAQQSTIGTHKTTKARIDNKLIVTYHSTAVVLIKNNRYVTLNSGGWYTNTTKTRMNQASNEYGLGYRVYQKDWDWFVEVGNNTYKYYDNIIIDIDKKVIVKD